MTKFQRLTAFLPALALLLALAACAPAAPAPSPSETAPAADFRQGPEALRHPYSKALWRALPQHEFRPIPGFQPYAGNLPSGCLFAPRCPCRTAECEKSVPPMQTVRKGEVRCFHAT